MAKFRTTEKDMGAQRIKQLIRELKSKPTVKMGILESAGTHKDDDGKESGLTVANIAVFNEFGTDRAPARPFMRYSAIIMAKPVQDLGRRLLDMMIMGQMTVDTALAVVGETGVATIKKVITDWDTPPNAPSTIKAKGDDNPLIDTSQMRNSVTYEKTRKK